MKQIHQFSIHDSYSSRNHQEDMIIELKCPIDERYEYICDDNSSLSLPTDPFYVLQRVLKFCAPSFACTLFVSLSYFLAMIIRTDIVDPHSESAHTWIGLRNKYSQLMRVGIVGILKITDKYLTAPLQHFPLEYYKGIEHEERVCIIYNQHSIQG